MLGTVPPLRYGGPGVEVDFLNGDLEGVESTGVLLPLVGHELLQDARQDLATRQHVPRVATDWYGLAHVLDDAAGGGCLGFGHELWSLEHPSIAIAAAPHGGRNHGLGREPSGPGTL